MDKKLEIILAAKNMTGKAFQNVDSRIMGLAKNVFSLRGAMIGLAGASAMGLFINKSVEAADKIAKTADKIGLTTDELQEYRYAAEIAGVAQNQLDMGMQRFSRRIAEVAAGTGELKAVAERYNIQLRNNDGTMRRNSAILANFADVIKNAESEQERLRIAFKLFDSEGAALVNMLSKGSASMDAMRKKAHDLGMVLDEDGIRNAEKLNDEFTTLSRIIKTQAMRAVIDLAPNIQTLTTELIDLTKEVNSAYEGFKMFFGIGEKNKLYSELARLTEELEKQERLQKWEGGNFLQKMLHVDRTKSIEYYRREINRVREEINKLDQPYKKSGTVGAGAAGQPETWFEKYVANEAAIKKVDADLKLFFDDLDEAQRKLSASAKRTWFDDYLADERKMKEIDADLDAFFYDIDEKNKDLSENINKTFGEDLKTAMTGWASDWSSTLTDMIFDANVAFDRILESFAKMIAQIMIQKSIVEPLVGGFTGWIDKAFSGGKAGGGPVAGGKTYLVGEEGPELFTAPTSGNIIPNRRLAMAGGGDTFNINFHIKTNDSRSFGQSLGEHKALVVGMVQSVYSRRGKRGGPLG